MILPEEGVNFPAFRKIIRETTALVQLQKTKGYPIEIVQFNHIPPLPEVGWLRREIKVEVVALGREFDWYKSWS